MDIYETKEGFVVLADLPGVDKSGLDVRVENDILTIQGKPTYQPGGRAVVQEFELLDFYRQFELPDTVSAEKIQAEMKHGVLTLRLPRAEKAKPKQIEVKVH
jgi:HSP20 family protein